jgi:glycosyltransferase involved in cell wall biosynthesis
VAVSRMQASEIERNTAVRPVIIPNLCDEHLFYPRSERAAGPFRFLTVGGLVEGKGMDTLLDGIAGFVARGGDALFTIVGVGPLEAQLRDQCTRLGLDGIVEWRGAVPRSELPDVFRSADAFVLPSQHESFGVVFIEALATGIPVIATRCGGPEEIVTDDDGLLIPVDDPQALALSMEQIATSAFDSSRIRERFLSRFSGTVVSAQIRGLYDAVLERAAA